MIIGNEAVKIGKLLFNEHIQKIWNGDNPNTKQLTPDQSLEIKDWNQLSLQLVTSKEAIQALEGVLKDDEYPLGKLGVPTNEIYLTTEFNAEIMNKQHHEAHKYIYETCPWMHELFVYLLRVFIPVGCPERYYKAGFSTNFAKGFLFYSYAKEFNEELAFETAVDYVHEVSHQLTLLLNEVDPLFTSDPDALVYSGIKGRKRPAMMALHGAIALSYMVMFRKFHKKVNKKFVFSSEEKLKNEADKLDVTIKELKTHCQFSGVGQKIMNDLDYVLNFAS